MISVQSSNIQAIGYDAENSLLVIDFLKGSTYEYYDVPEYEFNNLLNADSKGTYANQYIYKRYRQQRIR